MVSIQQQVGLHKSNSFLGFLRLKFLRCYVSLHELDQLVEVLICEIFDDCNFVK